MRMNANCKWRRVVCSAELASDSMAVAVKAPLFASSRLYSLVFFLCPPDLCHNVLCPYGKSRSGVHGQISINPFGPTRAIGATCIDGECVCAENCEKNAAEPLCANGMNKITD